MVAYCDVSSNPDPADTPYAELGFSLTKQTPPNPYWVIDGVRRSSFYFQKTKLVQQGFDADKTATEIMTERGYCRIYDCGTYTFEWTPDSKIQSGMTDK